MAKLLVQESNGAREFELVDLEVNIGRELDNTLRLSDPSISRHHAVVRLTPNGYVIRDLESSNGVLLNGNRVPEGPLRDGDRITLGQMQLTFVDPQPARGPSPLGTVRIDPEAMARLRAGTAPAPEAGPGPAQHPAGLPVELPAELLAELPPGPRFLHPFLPGLPDPAQPLRDADGTVQLGASGARFLATLIDIAPLLVLNLATLAASLAVAPLGLLFKLLQLALLAAYLVLLPRYWMHLGASPGKHLMRLRVVPEGDPAGRLDLDGALKRLLGYLVNGAIGWILLDLALRALHLHDTLAAGAPELLLHKALALAAGLLPYLLVLGPGRRALEDRFSRSTVIKVDR